MDAHKFPVKKYHSKSIKHDNTRPEEKSHFMH